MSRAMFFESIGAQLEYIQTVAVEQTDFANVSPVFTNIEHVLNWIDAERPTPAFSNLVKKLVMGAVNDTDFFESVADNNTDRVLSALYKSLCFMIYHQHAFPLPVLQDMVRVSRIN